MAKYLMLWYANPNIPWPDPEESANFQEMMWAGIDGMMKSGQILDYGGFTDGRSGYLIATGEAKEALQGANIWFPFMLMESHEIVPYEASKEAFRAARKIRAEAFEAMKR